jgi:hypothetical protein
VSMSGERGTLMSRYSFMVRSRARIAEGDQTRKAGQGARCPEGQ